MRWLSTFLLLLLVLDLSAQESSIQLKQIDDEEEAIGCEDRLDRESALFKEAKNQGISVLQYRISECNQEKNPYEFTIGLATSTNNLTPLR